VTRSDGLAAALDGLDRLVTTHAREHRDDELAASILLLAFAADALHVAIAGAGKLTATIVAARGEVRHVHGRAAALGTGIEPRDVVDRVTLRRDDLVVAATFPLDPARWPAGDRSAAALVALAAEPEASAAVVALG
jgi:hypothetical protein